MPFLRRIVPLFCFAAVVSFRLHAAPAPPGGDTIVFTNGEKLVGHLQSATDTDIVFKSDMVGVVTVKWTTVRELHTADPFAAIAKGEKPRTREESAAVPRGALTATNQQLQVAGAKPATLPISNIGNIVPESSYEKAFAHTSILAGWKGGATLGVSWTEATQTDESITGAINLVRTVPADNWLDLRSRTLLDFNEAYGKVTQPATPTVKTSLYHADGTQEWYFNPRLYAFGQAIFDHNYSQDLDLQQTYGGGIGLVVFKRPQQELDFKASMDYIRQQFRTAASNKSLIGSVFGETYTRTFTHKILFSEQAAITPAWNDTNAYSAFGNAALTFPVYHRLGFTIGALDNYLNDPPPGFQKNSFQLTVGATYAIQ